MCSFGGSSDSLAPVVVPVRLVTVPLSRQSRLNSTWPKCGGS